MAQLDPTKNCRRLLRKLNKLPRPDPGPLIQQANQIAATLRQLADDADPATVAMTAYEQAEQLAKDLEQALTIRGFYGPYYFLSNSYPAVIRDDLAYPTIEHAVQAAKSDDLLYRVLVRDCGNVSNAREIGRKVPGKGPTRGQMAEWLRQKFSDPTLKAKLLATAPSLLIEEDKWGDTFWGTKNGKGENHLGQLLMKLRKDLWDKEIGESDDADKDTD